MHTEADMRGAVRLATLQARIRARLEALDISADRASKEAGLGRTAIADILRGKSRQPSVLSLVEIARVLKCPLAYLLGERDSPVVDDDVELRGPPIPVVGVIEAGVFREMRDAEPWAAAEADIEFRQLMAPRSATYPKARHFAFEVRGDSMNAAKPRPIHEGDFALCVDIVDAEHTITDGEIYAVRRTMDGGQSYEWTLKRARVFRDRIELTPESTGLAHRPVVIPLGGHTDDHDAVEIRVVGLMYGTYSAFSRYS